MHHHVNTADILNTVTNQVQLRLMGKSFVLEEGLNKPSYWAWL